MSQGNNKWAIDGILDERIYSENDVWVQLTLIGWTVAFNPQNFLSPSNHYNLYTYILLLLLLSQPSPLLNSILMDHSIYPSFLNYMVSYFNTSRFLVWP